MTTSNGSGPIETTILASMERLAAAGIIGTTTDDRETGEGVLSFIPEDHRLVMAGRDVMREPAFAEAWMTGDPAVVRRWFAAEAALLDDRPADVANGDAP